MYRNLYVIYETYMYLWLYCCTTYIVNFLIGGPMGVPFPLIGAPNTKKAPLKGLIFGKYEPWFFFDLKQDERETGLRFIDFGQT